MAYDRYAPELVIVGEHEGDPVVRVTDYPYGRDKVTGELAYRKRVRAFSISGTGKTTHVEWWASIDKVPLSPSDQAFINTYTEVLV